MDIQFKCLPYSELKTAELYEIFALRQQVFIVEQNCPFLDADGRDQYAWHLMGCDNTNKLVAYTRLFSEGAYYSGYTSIGRVVTSAVVRSEGVGKLLMNTSIAKIRELFPNKAIKIGAQKYLEKFYNSFGFHAIGEEYMEDGIPHTIMVMA